MLDLLEVQLLRLHLLLLGNMNLLPHVGWSLLFGCHLLLWSHLQLLRTCLYLLNILHLHLLLNGSPLQLLSLHLLYLLHLLHLLSLWWWLLGMLGLLRVLGLQIVHADGLLLHGVDHLRVVLRDVLRRQLY